jgi:hypothetical protein
MLSALGVGFAATNGGLVLITVFLALVTLATLGWSAVRRRSSVPLALGTVGSLILIAGRVTQSDRPMYAGAALLGVASLWNLWVTRRGGQVLIPILAPDRERRTS